MSAQIFKLSPIASVFVSALVLTGCGGSSNNNSSSNKDTQTELQQAQGVWNKTAYGSILDIQQNSLAAYEYNEFGCIKVNQLSHDKAKSDLIATIKKSEDSLNIRQKGEIHAETYTSNQALPALCNTPITVSNDASPNQVFEYFWHAFNDYYAFFELRGVSWQQQYIKYKPQIKEDMSDQALFNTLAEMVAPLQDAHVNIWGLGDNFSVAKPSPFMQAAEGIQGNLQRTGEDVSGDDVLGTLFNYYTEISKSYLTPESVHTFPSDSVFPTILWGKTPDNVGLIVLNNLDNFTGDDNDTAEAQLKAADAMLSEVMTKMKDTEGLILDIRNNQGGHDAIALEVAYRFANNTILAVNKQAVNAAGKGVPVRYQVVKNDNAYTSPVYMLTSQMTVSAGEILAMTMAQFDHVTTLGEPTSGALSDILTFTLPNGWQIGLSNEVYRNAQGDKFEKIGIQPDQAATAFSIHGIESERFTTYDTALNELDKQTHPKISKAEFESQLEAIKTQGNIPSIAVGIIHDGEVVYKNGFGTADTNGTPITPDSRFYLASVSKTLLGATLAHAEQNKQIDLDKNIAPFLPFQIDMPQNAQNKFNGDLSLRHLITHSSGIVDNYDIYLCTYYLRADNSSLLNHVQQTETCPAQVDPDMPSFFANYLSSQGDYYLANNFATRYGLTTGDASLYSNIGAALAGYVLEQDTQQSIASLSQQYVFGPLNMHNTEWAEHTPSKPVVTRMAHSPISGELEAIPNYGSITYTDGNAVSTINDLSNFLQASLHQGKLGDTQALNQSAVSNMLSIQYQPKQTVTHHGYFWNIDQQFISHGGNDFGVRNKIFADKNAKNGFILLTNADSTNEASETAFNQLEALLLAFANGYDE